MLKRILLSSLVCSLLVGPAFAVDLLTQEDAVKRMFLTAEKVESETKTLTPAQLGTLSSKLGGKLYSIKKPAGANEAQYTFYFGMKGGKRASMAIIEEQEDKWGPLQFIIVIDLATKKVENMAMMKYMDGRARTLSNRTFLKSFFGKGLSDPLTIGKDIDGVSGATVSSEMLCFMVKKGLLLRDILYP
jgi:hypothetical protein